MEKAKTVTATFGTSLIVSSHTNGSIRLMPSLGLYPYGSQVQISAVPDPSYAFSLWGASFSGITNPLSLIVKSPTLSVSALFSTLSPGKFSLVVIPNGQGTVTISPQSNIFTNGQSVLVFAVPQSTNKFYYWSGDASGTNSPLNVSMNSSKIITANFSGGNYPATLSLNRGSGNLIQLQIAGEPRKTFEIQSSSNLLDWDLWTVVTNTNGTVRLGGQITNQTDQFYRAISR